MNGIIWGKTPAILYFKFVNYISVTSEYVQRKNE